MLAASCNGLWGVDGLVYGGGGGAAPEGGGSVGGTGGTTTSTGGEAGHAGGSGDWWDAAWSRRVKVSFGMADLAEPLSDFPVPVVLDTLLVASLGAGPAGHDLRFVDADGTTVLAHEIEHWSDGLGACLWVKVPSLTEDSPADFVWLYADNADAPAIGDPAAVWSNGFRAVWHLDDPAVDEATGGEHRDSTGHGNTGIQAGNARIVVLGHSLAGAQKFDGSNDRIEIASGGLVVTGTALTIEARAVVDSEPNEYPHVFGAGSTGRFWQIYWNTALSQGPVGWTARLLTVNDNPLLYSGAGALGQWSTVAVVYDGADTRLYVDGLLTATDTQTGSLEALDTPIRLGDNPVLSPRNFNGAIDEVRISDVARSEAWLAAQHAAQTGQLVTLGVVEQR